MLTIRNAHHRGRSTTEWLNSLHTFSFADYYSPEWMEWGFLRVINEDFIKPGSGFAMHAHKDMEIITYVVSGELSHHDSMGNGSIIKPGEVQRMSAGVGVRHSEFNNSATTSVHLLQIWIIPEKKSIQPSYEQKKIANAPDQLILIGSSNPTKNSIKIHQNINLYAGYFNKGFILSHALNNRRCWLQLIKGSILLNEQEIVAGDGVALYEEERMNIQCIEQTEMLFFEL
jgi:quercetin 2,3-dioxygenase